MKRFGYHENPVLSVQIPFWRSRLVLVLLFLGFWRPDRQGFVFAGPVYRIFAAARRAPLRAHPGAAAHAWQGFLIVRVLWCWPPVCLSKPSGLFLMMLGMPNPSRSVSWPSSLVWGSPISSVVCPLKIVTSSTSSVRWMWMWRLKSLN